MRPDRLLLLPICLAFLSLVLTPGAVAANQTKADEAAVFAGPMKRRCEFLRERDLRLLCTAYYPKEAKIKYKDQLVAPGTVFSVFMVDGETNRYFLTFHNSPLHACPRLRLLSEQFAQCVTPSSSSAASQASVGASGSVYTVSLWHSELHCFAFTLQLVDDLVEYCLEHKGRPRGITTDKNVMTALHYSDPRSWPSGAGRRAGEGSAVAPALAVLVTLWALGR